MLEHITEQQVAVYAAMHDATVTKTEHKHLVSSQKISAS